MGHLGHQKEQDAVRSHKPLLAPLRLEIVI